MESNRVESGEVAAKVDCTGEEPSLVDLLRVIASGPPSTSNRVGFHKFEDGLLLSTVKLSFAHGKDKQGRELWFETMLLEPDGTDLRCWRYATLNEASAGHAKMAEEEMAAGRRVES